MKGVHLKSYLLFMMMVFCLLFTSCSNTKKLVGKDRNFVQLFNGKNLDGWEGDSTYWSVRDGIIIGEITPETLLEKNSFLIWRDGEVRNFELKVEYRISENGNSGINYRSEEVIGDPDKFIGGIPFALKGYQGDLDGKNRYTGMNYEERKRTTIAVRGEKVVLPSVNLKDQSLENYIERNQWKPRIVQSSLGNSDSLAGYVNEGWNEYHIIARGNHLQHYINGILMSEVVDDDKVNRRNNGLLGVQVHVGPPMKVEYRSILLKELK